MIFVWVYLFREQTRCYVFVLFVFFQDNVILKLGKNIVDGKLSDFSNYNNQEKLQNVSDKETP